MVQWQRIRLQCRRRGFDPWVGKILWRRKWQLTPVFLPGKAHGQRSLAGSSTWGHEESDMTKRLNNNIASCSQWHPTPVLLPGKSHGQRSLAGSSPWGRQESDTAERLHFHFSLFTFMHWRRKWQPTPVFFPGESQGQGSLVGCRLWGRTESLMTEVT